MVARKVVENKIIIKSIIMFERPILLFSDYCIHSTNFINSLMKHPEIYEEFIRVNIDVNPSTKMRADIFYTVQAQLQHKITEVPTIVINKGEYVLAGVEAFKWLEHITQKEELENELTPFNPNEMGSFSDSYSPYGSKIGLHDAKEQSFKFINRPDEKINTPDESTKVSKDDFSQKQKERETFDNINSNVPPPFQKRSIQHNNMTKNEKERDFESRLQQMLSEREQFDQVKTKNVKNAIFSRG